MTAHELFDLVAPIAICGGTDCSFNVKAQTAWRKIKKEINLKEWAKYGCRMPPDIESIEEDEDFNAVYADWVWDTYNRLFEEVVESVPGTENLKKGIDRFGAKGYENPMTSQCIYGDACGFYPWYETAALVVERFREFV